MGQQLLKLFLKQEVALHFFRNAYELTLTGAVPGVEGLSAGVGYAKINKSSAEAGGVDNNDQDEGTYYVKYAVGGFTLGISKKLVTPPARPAFDSVAMSPL